MSADPEAARRLFHAAWYLDVYPDVRGQDPFEHFRRIGAAEGRDPNPMFDTSWYRRRYPDAGASGANPLDDFVGRGVALGRDPGPLFSTSWYLARYPDVAAAGTNPLEHYLEWGRFEGRDPSPVFDTAWYSATYKLVAEPGVDARMHHLRQGAAAGYDPGPWFHTGWYLQTYPEIAASGINPLLHYLTEGADKGYDPSVSFSSSEYLEKHKDCAERGDNPLVHHLAEERLMTRSVPVVSKAAVVATKRLIEAFAELEPDLAAIPGTLAKLPARPLAPDRSMAAWRALYLSIDELPKHVVLVGCIDGQPDLADAFGERQGLLVVETDSTEASTAEALPRGTPWRSLSEFVPDLDAADRIRLVTALVNNLQPAALTVRGSRAGWEVVSRYGKALRRSTSLFATTTASPEPEIPDLLRSYLRACLPALSALYAPDQEELDRIASRFGLPPSVRKKLQVLRRDAGTGREP